MSPWLRLPGTESLADELADVDGAAADGLVARARAAAGRAYTPPSAGDPGLAGIDSRARFKPRTTPS